MRAKVITIVAVIAAMASAALTLLPWIDISQLGFPLRWNGLGVYVGEDDEHYGPLLNGMVSSTPGWIVLIASIAAAGALIAAPRVRWLKLVACGCAVVVFVIAVSCLVYPALLVGVTREELGASGLAAREFLNSGVLIAEAVTAAVLVICTAFIALQRQADRAEGDATPGAE